MVLKMRLFALHSLAVAGLIGAGLVTGSPPASADTRCFTTSGAHADTRTCHTVDKRFNRVFVAGYQDGVNNRKGYPIQATCTATTQTKQSYSVSSSVEAEAGGIFLTIKASISASISKEMTSGFSTSATFKVPPHSYVYCDRGILNERVAGHSVRTVCEHQQGCTKSRKSWEAKAPSRRLWKIFS